MNKRKGKKKKKDSPFNENVRVPLFSPPSSPSPPSPFALFVPAKRATNVFTRRRRRTESPPPASPILDVELLLYWMWKKKKKKKNLHPPA